VSENFFRWNFNYLKYKKSKDEIAMVENAPTEMKISPSRTGGIPYDL